MFCTSCGKQLETGASFCSRCGQAVKEKQSYATPAGQPLASELCEIAFRHTSEAGAFSRPRGKFIAEAIGQRGKYLANGSFEFPLNRDGSMNIEGAETLGAHEDLVYRLSQTGWQPAEGSSVVGFNLRFRRTVSQNLSVNLDIYLFYSTWDPLSKRAVSELERIAVEFGGKFTIRKIDVDGYPAMAQQYKITGVPSFIVLKSGRECDRILGIPPGQQLSERIRGLL